jgi:hypothetical protein
MATLDDSALDSLRQLDSLRDRAKELRERGRKALANIPKDFKKKNYETLEKNCDLTSDKWVSGPHPIDVALLVRVLNHRDLGDYEFDPPRRLSDTLPKAITTLFTDYRADDMVPTLTAARAMHALVSKPQTVFSTATMLCYYRIVRELYLATFPNWIIGAARAGEGGRVSAFVTGECVRAIRTFQDSIGDTITFFHTTKKFLEELERLRAIPQVDSHLTAKSKDERSRWKDCLEIEFERLVLDWYAANDLRHNVIALDLSQTIKKRTGRNSRQKVVAERSLIPSLFPLAGKQKISRPVAEKALNDLPKLLRSSIKQAQKSITKATILIKAFRKKESRGMKRTDVSRFQEITETAHKLGLGVIEEALDEANKATDRMQGFRANNDLSALLDGFIRQYSLIHKRIQRIIDPAKRYIQDVLNRELAQAANSAKFDAGELLFAAACFGALTKWKQNQQLAEARRLLTAVFPEDGRLQTTRPFQSTRQGLRLIPIAFEMSRCFAQLLQKDFAEDLDPSVVRKILNAFEDPIALAPAENETIGWNFRGAPEGQKPSVWVTAIAVLALDRTVRMLNERINAMVLRHFNVERPNSDVESLIGVGSNSAGKLDMNGLMYPDYELQSAFKKSGKYEKQYQEDPPRVDGVSVAIRLQQMRAHLTRALLPDFYSRKGTEYEKAYSAIFYGPPGTGKTTLAEALAATARVPLVRLSPSDLMVQGTDVIESRARAIFDSLSMLTRAVIFLDEFEPVVRTRSQMSKDETESKNATGSGTARDSPQDPPEFRFLVTGMLPKLIKLNKTAKKQSVVYCLATNYLIQVDKAAKRIGRFDLQIPIYHPDPMSRIGVFLYRLVTILQEEEKKTKRSWKDSLARLQLDPKFWKRAHEAIAKTEEVSAQSLATIFFSTTSTKAFFNYARSKSKNSPSPTQERSVEKDKTWVEKDIEAQRNEYEESWKNRLLGQR